MALGSNKVQIRSLDYIKRNLMEHSELTLALTAAGVPSKEASKQAYAEITTKKSKRGAS